jgi:formate dehydrogenase subunit delta
MSEGQAAATVKLARMANQIARAFAAQGPDEALANTAAHIKSFWTPKMRRDLAAHLDDGNAALDPLARAAIEKLTRA